MIIEILCDSYTGCLCGVCSEYSNTELVITEGDTKRTVYIEEGFFCEADLREYLSLKNPELNGWVLNVGSEFY